MTPGKLLIAQRLVEAAHELRAIASLTEEYKHDPEWSALAAELAGSADAAESAAIEIRLERL